MLQSQLSSVKRNKHRANEFFHQDKQIIVENFQITN